MRIASKLLTSMRFKLSLHLVKECTRNRGLRRAHATHVVVRGPTVAAGPPPERGTDEQYTSRRVRVQARNRPSGPPYTVQEAFDEERAGRPYYPGHPNVHSLARSCRRVRLPPDARSFGARFGSDGPRRDRL